MRFLNLLRAEAQLHIQGSLLYALGIIVFWLLVPVHQPFFFMLYSAGCLLASASFTELHNPTKAYRLLTLPCSNLEKWLSKWFITTIGFIVFLLGLFYLTVLLRLVIYTGIFDIFNINFNLPTLSHFGETLLVFLPMNAALLVGSCYFKRYVLVKTGLLLSLLFVILSRIFLSIGFSPMLTYIQHTYTAQTDINHFLMTLLWVVWGTFILSMYSLSYYIYTKTEIK